MSILTGLTLDQIERLLDTGQLTFAVAPNRHWRVRRNGRTQRWKRTPTRFRIPVKIGFRNYHEITSENYTSQPWTCGGTSK